MRRFNASMPCNPKEHYMVDISGKLGKIVKMVNDECYFTIELPEKYGKTTTLMELEKKLEGEYFCARIGFGDAREQDFSAHEAFYSMFLGKISEALAISCPDRGYAQEWRSCDILRSFELDEHISRMCRGRKIVLMIDEVDAFKESQMMGHCLSVLRAKYQTRTTRNEDTFHSVILAGVHDVKCLYRIPWNIASDFHVDMSFSPSEIATMLSDYEMDHQTKMDIGLVADAIFEYTHGHPFMVSRICQCMDEELGGDWTRAGVRQAVKILMLESDDLFETMTKTLDCNPELHDFLYGMILAGRKNSFVHGNPS